MGLKKEKKGLKVFDLCSDTRLNSCSLIENIAVSKSLGWRWIKVGHPPQFWHMHLLSICVSPSPYIITYLKAIFATFIFNYPCAPTRSSRVNIVQCRAKKTGLADYWFWFLREALHVRLHIYKEICEHTPYVNTKVSKEYADSENDCPMHQRGQQRTHLRVALSHCILSIITPQYLPLY